MCSKKTLEVLIMEEVSLKEYLESKFAGSNALMRAEFDLIKMQMNHLDKEIKLVHTKQDYTNGKVRSHVSEIESLKRAHLQCRLPDMERKLNEYIKDTEEIRYLDKHPFLKHAKSLKDILIGLAAVSGGIYFIIKIVEYAGKLLINT